LLLLMMMICHNYGNAQDSIPSSETDTILATDSSEIVQHHEDSEEEDTATALTFSDRFTPVTADTLNKLRMFSEKEKKKLKSDEDFWYANTDFKKEEEQEQTGERYGWLEKLFRFLGNPTVHTILWVLMILILLGGFIIYLNNNRAAFFGSRGRKISPLAGMKELSDNIFEIDFDTHIGTAVQEGNYRMATRLLFLRLLRNMNNQGVLAYQIDKTNMDYLFELKGSDHFKDFAVAARNYEYIWYGKFDLTPEQFGHLKGSFEKFV